MRHEPSLRPIHAARLHIPHVVRFSGGRSSGMMLMLMLDQGMLRSDRGDVVVFSNTSAEHPATYAFVRKCARQAERRGIPFFWLEFATYETAIRGIWSRKEGVRLATGQPFTRNRPNGYRWRGEVFDEMIAHTGHIPSRHARACTQRLKIQTTHEFLRHWLAGREAMPRQGHKHDGAQMTDRDVIVRHRAANGRMRDDELLRYKEAVRATPPAIPAQRFADYSLAAVRGPDLANGASRATLHGNDAVEYLSFIGLRGDERMRVANVRRANNAPDGEIVETPLADAGIAAEDVAAYWQTRPKDDLRLPAEANLSNCAFCFMKGANGLRRASVAVRQVDEGLPQAQQSRPNTPSDLQWWADLEKRRSRTYPSTKGGQATSGFWGVNAPISYQALANGRCNAEAAYGSLDQALPCHCTD